MKIIVFMLPFLAFIQKAMAQTIIQIVLKNGTQHHIEKLDAFDLSQKEIYTFNYQDTFSIKFNNNNIDCYNIRYHEDGKSELLLV